MRNALLLLVVVAAACDRPSSSNQAQPADAGSPWTTETAWRLEAEPAVEIQGPTGNEPVEGAPLDPLTFYRLHDGRYALADGGQGNRHAIMLYDSTGRYLTELGRKGSGPGEFGQLYYWSGLYRGNDSIAAFDVQHKMHIWTVDGTFRRTLQLPARGFVYGVFGDGSVLSNGPIDRESTAREGERTIKQNIFDQNGKLVRTLHDYTEIVARTQSGQPEIRPRPVIGVGRTHLYFGSEDAFAVHVIDTAGQEVRVLRRDVPRARLSDTDKEEMIAALIEASRTSPEQGPPGSLERYEKSLRENGKWPEYRPFYSTFVEDGEGNVWIEHFRMLYPTMMSLTPKPIAWSVFDTTGTFFGEVTMPAGFVATSITRDQVLGLFQDSLGVQHARAYRLLKR